MNKHKHLDFAIEVAILLFLFFSASLLHLEALTFDGVAITAEDYRGLQALRREFVDPGGVLRSWNGTGMDACSGSWAGVKCANGKVIALQLPWRRLAGQLSDAGLGQLTALRRLSLHDNSIAGPIPSSFQFLIELRGLYLFNNRFSGTIPPAIGACKALQAVDLSNNLLTGEIPGEIANSSRLVRLNVSYNQLAGAIPERVFSSPSLAFLSLEHNNLSGAFPNEASLPKIQTMDFSYNGFGGIFPYSWCNFSTLQALSLEGNQLSSQIPEAIDGLMSVSILSLKRNHFYGEIPAAVGKLSALSSLDLSENKLTGGIPSSLANLAILASFNVSINNLSGPVPVPLAKKFGESSFQGNLQLCGFSASRPCPSPSPRLAPSSSPRRRHRKLSKLLKLVLIITGSVLAASLLLLLICGFLLCCFRKKKYTSPTRGVAAAGRGEKPSSGGGTEVESGGETGGKLVHFDGQLGFSADDLLCATAEIMGKSTYGTVYKATLEDGNQVAVKRLREKITKGQKEFELEVNILGKIRHPNLLALRAYYLGPKGEKLLVFDYMPKGSLAAFLHARAPNTSIDWSKRINIIKGIARGLCYLHNDKSMIHGNLTSSNVLLDELIDAKIADFGLSKLMTATANSSVLAAAGALGYRAPELSKIKKANMRTDIYSFGVIMLELLTGKSSADAAGGGASDDLPRWVASIVQEEWTNEVFDLELMKDAAGSAGDELLNTLKLALHCVDPSPTVRPESQDVLKQLEEIRPSAGSGEGAGVPT